MKSIYLTLTLLLSSVLIFTSCDRQPEHINSVPEDAFAVMTMKPDPGQRDEMVKSLKENEEYNNAMDDLREENESMADLLEDFIEDPETSGLDLQKEMFVFASPIEDNVLIGAVILMKKAETFEKVLKEIFKEMEMSVSIEDEDGFKKLAFPQGIAVWNDKQLLVLGSDSDGNVESKAKELMNQKAKESITTNKDFSEFYSNCKDLNIWLSSNIDNMSDQIAFAEKAFGVELNNNFSHMHFDWDKKEGQFTFIAKLRVNEEIREMDMNDISEIAEQTNMLNGLDRYMGGKSHQKTQTYEDELSQENINAAKAALDTMSEEDAEKAIEQLEKELDTDLSEME